MSKVTKSPASMILLLVEPWGMEVLAPEISVKNSGREAPNFFITVHSSSATSDSRIPTCT